MGRACTICNHKSVKEIDRALIEGKSKAAISREYAVSADALFNHNKNHLSRQLRKGFELKEKSNNLDVMEQLSTMMSKVNAVLERSESVRDDKAILAATKEMRGFLGLLAQIQINLHAQRQKGLDPEELEEFRNWRAEKARLIKDTFDLSQEDQDILTEACILKISRMSGSTAREEFVKNSEIYQDYGPPLEEHNFDRGSKDTYKPDPPTKLDSGEPREEEPREVEETATEEPALDQEPDQEEMRPNKPAYPPVQIPSTKVDRDELARMNRDIDFGPRK